MVNRFTGPIIILVLTAALLIGVCYGFGTLFNRMTTDLPFGVVTVGALGLAIFYVISQCAARITKI